MGWSSWNYYGCDINENIVRSIADALVSTGLSKLGYVYVNIDDCWQASRSRNGTILEDPKRFPSGMRALSDYVHSLGLKFGLYSSAGTLTCEKRPGGLHHELQDAKTYIRNFKIDYLKYDNCFNEGMSDRNGTLKRYGDMRDALRKVTQETGTDGVVYSVCNWGEANVWEIGNLLGHSWRATGDVCDVFQGASRKSNGRACGVMDILDEVVDITGYSGPGGFNDLDMLEVGNGNMTYDEYVTHFSAWSVLKSPLILGNDITSMSRSDLVIVSNPDLIAVNQDPLGISARLAARVYFDGDQNPDDDDGDAGDFHASRKHKVNDNGQQHFPRWVKFKRENPVNDDPSSGDHERLDVWVGPLANGDHVLLIVNRGEISRGIEIDLEVVRDSEELNSTVVNGVGVKKGGFAHRHPRRPPSRAHVRDLWSGDNFVLHEAVLKVGKIRPHASVIYRVNLLDHDPLFFYKIALGVVFSLVATFLLVSMVHVIWKSNRREGYEAIRG
ncbi:hypothetical protein HDU76_000567 [Blyttiomyces sp. JEL0837]|nr:hypothetical protein HDU76_000567 [Blyttiomyces sp. JEL0837]